MKLQLAVLVQASIAVACTAVTPIGNRLPEGGATATLSGEHMSLAETA
jgi:hypothetical protein